MQGRHKSPTVGYVIFKEECCFMISTCSHCIQAQVFGPDIQASPKGHRPTVTANSRAAEVGMSPFHINTLFYVISFLHKIIHQLLPKRVTVLLAKTSRHLGKATDRQFLLTAEIGMFPFHKNTLYYFVDILNKITLLHLLLPKCVTVLF